MCICVLVYPILHRTSIYQIATRDRDMHIAQIDIDGDKYN